MSSANPPNVQPYRTVKTTNRESHELKCLSPTKICFLFGLLIALIAILINNIDLKSVSTGGGGDEQAQKKPLYAVFGKNIDSGYLKHVYEVLDKFGYTRGAIDDEWDLLWSHDYPFKKLSHMMQNLKPHQKVNHFPGSGYITNKVDLVSSKMLAHVPKAFKIPIEKDEFLDYSKKNPEKQFVQKSNSHRGIKIFSMNDTSALNRGETFMQEYIDKPFLIDGYKFDIGIYTMLTSIDPLRLYIYDGDVLFRFCTQKYYPFDAANIDKYVIGDDYLPIWEVPSLKKYYVDLGFSMKESFNAYLRSKGLDPLKVWDVAEEAIRNIYLEKETSIIQTTSLNYQKHNFFEMVRIDLIIDEDLNVYIMEANMSPNLSSAHFAPNRLLYQQVLFNLFGLIGVGRSSIWNRTQEENDMEVAIKDIVVSPRQCSQKSCRACISPQCHLCRYCWTSDTRKELQVAFLEHINRGLCKRIFPPPIFSQAEANKTIVWEKYSPENQLIYRWFQEKCLLDQNWCI